ncbi:head-to-tail adaptor [Mycobacterium phage MalagasyRose]|uniref:Head-to-tail adaptor n=1 Tax=Mycobacterium phage MalagasyRose TaxID=2599870 RepID=A0A5J6TE40_9CAUD|nr:head-to-tail adaptor [Mycobacterium phage MalagasyRose]QFG08865.1 head-to-tail adaptor [Mycobacterium phage MalagasyRose]
MAYAEPPDLVSRWHSLTPDQTAKATTLFGDAAFWLGVWVPGLEAAASDPSSKAATAAKLLSVAMVKRALQAEENDQPGAQVVQETAGIYTEQITYRNPEGNLYLYDRERNDLLAIVTGLPAGAVSMTSPGL